ncbi:putative disease resistance RPP13-like protein 3 [Tasmannia lanceolata]|uniref:putative disease resistance RPP13-like protein 3 n=1 Tax=Tasmannia lanceolata TaxID=3420 RepID=UPI004062E12B
MQSFIKESETKKKFNEGARNWTMEVRDVAYKVEHIIDEFIYLKKEIHDNFREEKRYGFEKAEEGSTSNDDTERWRHYAESSLFTEEDDLLAIEENKDMLVRWLIAKEASVKLYAVVGMGGLEKITLVTQAYKSQAMKKHFRCHTWISVSQSYRIKELLKSLIKELFKENRGAALNEIGMMDYRQLLQTIISHLQGKRYLVVLDDVWNMKVWSLLRFAFPDNKCGSRVMLTTRQEDVASSFSSSLGGIGSHVFHLKPLHVDKALTLFCKKAFWNIPERRCPREFESPTRHIVGKCRGLPLAIVAIGSLMALRETAILEWLRVENSLGSELSNNTILERLKNILLLSFNDLQSYRKHFFLYCSIFPVDYQIRRTRWSSWGAIFYRNLEIKKLTKFLYDRSKRGDSKAYWELDPTKFGITMGRREDGTELCASLPKMKYLLGLKVMTKNEEEALDLESLPPPPLLQKISLFGPIENIPHWVGTHENLKRAYDGQELCFHAGDFPKLKMLCSLGLLNTLVVSTLKELYLWEMPEQLVEGLRKDVDGDRPKVCHIPIIRHRVLKEGKWVVEYLSLVERMPFSENKMRVQDFKGLNFHSKEVISSAATVWA